MKRRLSSALLVRLVLELPLATLREVLHLAGMAARALISIVAISYLTWIIIQVLP